MRILRTLLALSVSFWMAGAGCMLGCSNSAHAAVPSPTTQTVIAGASCHSAGHDCCATKQNKATVARVSKTSQQSLSLLGTLPEGMMADCPLVVNASAVTTSKVTDNSSNQTRTPSAELVGLDNFDQIPDWTPTPVHFQNRGPTYLSCCVFLI